MKRLYFFALLSLVLCVSCTKKETDPEVIAMRGLVNRVVPEYSQGIVLERLADTIDRFEIETQGKNLVIRGNNANSMAVGLNHYLKYYCKAQYSWFIEEPLQIPAAMPKVTEKVSLSARVPDRFFLNYCTFGYTLPWWNWSQWEHFIDWMALNGINLPLAITGQESVWYEVWSDFGLTDEEIRSYFTGPAHLPWHRMQNIDRWGGPLPMSWLENQKELQKKIVARERELNMKPVLPGFAGHVPPCITRVYPDAPLASLGDWAGFDSTCWCKFLDPECELYSQIQKKFIEKEIEFYGTDHIFELMENLRFKVGPKSFYQTNTEQAYELYKVARDFAGLTGNELVYDLYTGTGTIANFVAKKAKKVIGIEYVPEAIEDAKVNSSINNIDNTLFYAGDMKDILNRDFIEEHGRPDVIITDPPRAGMHQDVIDTILFAEPKRIVYVSCNPATQARDLQLLDVDYKVLKIQPVDMFPHTQHVENVVLLERR